MRILIADDHDLVRYGLKKLLVSLDSGVTVAEARNFDEAMHVAEEPDDLALAILDLNMPGMKGFAGVTSMCQHFPGLPVVILSASLDREHVFNAISHGAQGFIPKTLSGTAILNALRLILSGEKFIPSMVLDSDSSLGVMPASKPLEERTLRGASGDTLTGLTLREKEVLGLLTHGHSNKEIARQLGVQEVTIKAHLKRLFRKLGVSNRTQAVKLAIQQGWEG